MFTDVIYKYGEMSSRAICHCLYITLCMRCAYFQLTFVAVLYIWYLPACSWQSEIVARLQRALRSQNTTYVFYFSHNKPNQASETCLNTGTNIDIEYEIQSRTAK